jgi:hypothetical protein
MDHQLFSTKQDKTNDKTNESDSFPLISNHSKVENQHHTNPFNQVRNWNPRKILQDLCRNAGDTKQPNPLTMNQVDDVSGFDCGSIIPTFRNLESNHRSNLDEKMESTHQNEDKNGYQKSSERDITSDSSHNASSKSSSKLRGRNDTSGGKEAKSNSYRRGTNKKARAAHQASSPSPQSSANSRLNNLQSSDKKGERDASPPPSIRMINGIKVTIVDEELKVFVVDLLSPETCDLVRRMADDHVRQVSESGSGMPTWRTLYTYTKQDLPCSEVKGLTTSVTDLIMANVANIVGEIYGRKKEALKLRPRSWKEPHLLLYQHLPGKPVHSGVEMHYDGCDITWNAMLSKSSEYEGGGTYIRSLRKTIRLEQGQVLIQPGELYHKGVDITSGVRALIVCFMDGFDPRIVDPSSAQEDRSIYERNVRMY